MGYYDNYIESDDFLAHHGILGQKWGVRRYQNKDGTLTEAGRKKAAMGAAGRAQILREGEAKARNKRIQGSIAKGAAQVAGTAGGALGGAALGSSSGPLGTVAGFGVGVTAGTAVGKVAGKVTKALYNEKANAINNEYLILANDIMKEYGNTKVKDISTTEDRKSANESKTRSSVIIDGTHKINISTDSDKPDMLDRGKSIFNKSTLTVARYDLGDITYKEAVNRYNSDISLKDFRKKFNIYGISINEGKNGRLNGEINCEVTGKNSPYGDHSLDFEWMEDEEEKGKIKIDRVFSING